MVVLVVFMFMEVVVVNAVIMVGMAQGMVVAGCAGHRVVV